MPPITDILTEATLWEIYRKSPRLWTNKFNTVVVAATALLLTVFSIMHAAPPAWASYLKDYSLHDTLLNWASLGFTYTATMLAFLLAGFTILGTITKPSLLVKLAEITHPGTKLSELKYTFFVFINVFIQYLAFLATTTAILLFGTKNGPFVLVGELIKVHAGALAFNVIQHAALVIIGTWFVLLILKLKSFIYNTYQMVVLAIVNEGATITKDD